MTLFDHMIKCQFYYHTSWKWSLFLWCRKNHTFCLQAPSASWSHICHIKQSSHVFSASLNLAPSLHCISVWFQIPFWGQTRALLGSPASTGGRESACQFRRHETCVRSLGGEDPLEEATTTHSSILAWRIPWTEEPGGLQSLEAKKVKTGLSYLRCTHAMINMFLPVTEK